jgi:hypothetical protein
MLFKTNSLCSFFWLITPPNMPLNRCCAMPIVAPNSGAGIYFDKASMSLHKSLQFQNLNCVIRISTQNHFKSSPMVFKPISSHMFRSLSMAISCSDGNMVKQFLNLDRSYPELLHTSNHSPNAYWILHGHGCTVSFL